MDMVHYTNKPIGKGMQYPNRYTKNSVTSYLHDAENVRVNKICIYTSVATKIKNGPKTNMKILRFMKIDRRRIRRIFVNSKILRRSSKIANSSNIFEDTKIFKGK